MSDAASACKLPVLPLKETVVFPESMTPLAVGQERSVKLIDDVVSGERMLALITVRNPEADPPGWDDLYRVGTLAVVHKMIKVPDGTLRILVQGLQRVRLVEPQQEEPYLDGRARGAAGRAFRTRPRWRRSPATSRPSSRTSSG